MEYLIEIYHFETSQWVQGGHKKLVRDVVETMEEAKRTANIWYDPKEVRAINITPILSDQKIDYIEELRSPQSKKVN